MRIDLSVTTAVGTNTYTATYSPPLLSYPTNQEFFIQFQNANTGASTLNINGLGAKNIVKGQNPLITGDIMPNQILNLVYDGTNFQLIGSAGIASVAITTTPSFLSVSPSSLTHSGTFAFTVGTVPITSGGTGLTTSSWLAPSYIYGINNFR